MGPGPSQLDAQVASRIPVGTDRDNRYFTDRFQAMPLHGYTRLFENMVDHSRIKILLGIDFRELAREIDFRDLIYTGPIDEFFDYRFGPLPYRSLRFKHKNYKREFFQPVAVVNHPNRHRYTRVTEMKHLTGQQHPSTSVIYEYPTWDGDPYYPVPQSANLELYQQYRGLASEKKMFILSGGWRPTGTITWIRSLPLLLPFTILS
jgi:UDP-galactopyranose mutase